MMTCTAFCAATLLLSAPTDFDAAFTGRTLRVDTFHTLVAAAEQVSLDEIRLEGRWPGSRVSLIDDMKLGKYLFRVTDAASGTTLFCRGYCSLFGEWETTKEAREGVRRTFARSHRFPEPRNPFRLSIWKRGRDGSSREIFSTAIDPASRFVNRAHILPRGTAWTVLENGPPSRCVDLLVLPDGYAESDMETFHAQVKRLVETLMATEPYRSLRSKFNVRAIDVVSPASGISDPRRAVWRESPLGLRFNSFDLPRYILTLRNRELREIAAQAPYDVLVLLANARKYGGGGIFGLWATCAAGNPDAPYVFVHEFGHTLAGLADEYYTSPVAYEDFTPSGTEPWEPNITAHPERSQLKWRDLVGPQVPLPTAWPQAAYDKVSLACQKERRALMERGASDAEMEALSRRSAARVAPILQGARYAGTTGAFEGAGYKARGLYRGEVDCIMFSRVRPAFCRVCRRAIERRIRFLAR